MSEEKKLIDADEAKESGSVVKTDIVNEMKKSYIDYSMSVIVSRALPDVRDGLKPSQRRILVSMNDLKLYPNAHYRKCAKIVGDMTGDYHPHGNAAAYETLVNLAQDFGMRYPLVDGQGNFGTIDGDPAAQMRYTEARMTKLGSSMLKGLKRSAVCYRDNYDGTKKEPVVLASLFPNLICNGCDGIAVGMATKIAPHNLSEVVDALVAMLDDGNKFEGEAVYNDMRERKEKAEKIPQIIESRPYSLLENYLARGEEELPDLELEDNQTLYPIFESDMTIEDLMEYIPGPDFPTGGTVYTGENAVQMYKTGRGKVVMRAKADIQELDRGKHAIIVKEIPYQTNKATLVEKIARLVRDDKVDGIVDLRDESTMEGIRIYIELKRSANPKKVLNKLYKFTHMQRAFHTNMIALIKNQPRKLNLKDILEEYLTHQLVVTIRAKEYILTRRRYRQHILEGLKIALDNLDEVIKTIRNSPTQEKAKSNLMEKFEMTGVQAEAILDMQLRRLAALERQKVEDEYVEVTQDIKDLVALLNDQDKILSIIRDKLLSLKEKYGDERRTEIVRGKVGEFRQEDLIENKPSMITITHSGYIKRTELSAYRTQNRGGKGSRAASTKDGDFIEHAFSCNSHDSIMFFTDQGKVYDLKAYEIEEYSKQAKGKPLVNYIEIESEENITAVVPKPKEDSEYKYLLFATKQGQIKKTELSEYENIRNSGLIAINLNEGDELGWVKATKGDEEIMLFTEKGKSIRFKEDEIKDTGRNTKGVIGIKFSYKEDEVMSMSIVKEDSTKVLNVSENGFGKFTNLDNYPIQKRGGKGVKTMDCTDKTGLVAEAKIVSDDVEEMLVVSQKGILIRTNFEKVPTLSRITQGVTIMKLNKNDQVSSLAII